MHCNFSNFCLISGLIIVLITACDRYPASVDHLDLPRHSLSIDGEVEFNGRVSWDGKNESLSTIIRAENAGEEPAEIKYGPCSFTILAYTLSEENSKLIWNNNMPEDYTCLDEMLTYTIEPNESAELDGLMYISGKEWMYDLPKGERQFVLEAKSKNGRPINIPINKVLID